MLSMTADAPYWASPSEHANLLPWDTIQLIDEDDKLLKDAVFVDLREINDEVKPRIKTLEIS